jgi:hypothetical protein
MAGRRARLARLDRALLVEAFVTANLAFLVLDVLLAHSANEFHHPGEWVPVGFAAAATVLLAANLAAGRPFAPDRGRRVGLVVGAGAIAVGVLGLAWHLESRFFEELTLRSLVYSAPFAAPLAFAGLGFLLLLNRMVPPDSEEWARWVVFLAWGGFVGDFVLSLFDHAINGFFYPAEWVAVGVSALAVGYFLVMVVAPTSEAFLLGGLVVLALQVVTGLVGFVLHALPALTGGSEVPLRARVVFGAPIFAPLLFANLSLLAAIGILALRARMRRAEGLAETP